LPNALSLISSGDGGGGGGCCSSGGPYNSPAIAALQRGSVGRHLANRNELRASGSDSYALLFLLHVKRHLFADYGTQIRCNCQHAVSN